jgi:HPt (histidine-containing phosphotransfer) domain-containing protein
VAQVAVEQLAFARPGGEGEWPSGGRAIDLVHLARQTFGERALEEEILAMFRSQILSIKSRLRDAQADDRKTIAHGLKGSSRSVGAFALADAAAVLELTPASDAQVREIERRIDDVIDFIAAISR